MAWLPWRRGRTWRDVGAALEAQALAERAEARAKDAAARAATAVETARQDMTARAARLAEANARLEVRSYEAARARRRWNDWRAPSSDADAAAYGTRRILRDRVRDLVRNDPHMKSAVKKIAAHYVGTGIRPRPMTRSDAFNALATRLWDEWVPNACVSGKHGYYALQRAGVRGTVTDGEVLIRRINPARKVAPKVPLQLQVLEADFLDSTKDGQLDNGNWIIEGIEFAPPGRCVAYWLHTEHPGGRKARSPKSVRVPASEIVHVYDLERAGQSRGVTWLSAVVKVVRDLGDYNDAELMKQKIAACFGLIAEGGEVTGDTLTEKLTDAWGDVIEDLYPGMIAYLAEGKSVTVLDPPSTAGHDQFNLTTLHRAAAGAGLTYAQMTGDLRGANFSSTRAGLNEFWAQADQDVALTFVPSLCDRVWQWWVEAAYVAGLITAPTIPVQWTTPARPSVNPAVDGAARRARIREGVSTLSIETAALGHDLRQVLDERKREKELLAELGLTFDTSSWEITGAGQPWPGVEAEELDPPPNADDEKNDELELARQLRAL